MKTKLMLLLVLAIACATLFADNLPPLITHLPLLNTPMYGTPQKVTATITDDATYNSPISSTKLHYSTDNSTFTELNMSLSGTNKYSAYIPNQALGTQVWYYVRAVDSAANDSLTTTYSFKFEDPTTLQYGGVSTYLGYTGYTTGGLNVFTNPMYGSGYAMKLNSTFGRIRYAATANLYIYKSNNYPISQGGLIPAFGPLPVALTTAGTVVTDLSAYNITIDTPYFCVSYQDVPPNNHWATDTTKFYNVSYIYRNGTLYNFSGYGTMYIGANIGMGSSLNAALNEGFEAAMFPPLNWKTVNGGDPNQWARATSAPHTGTGHAVIDSPWPPMADHDDWLITPRLRPTNANHTLTFWSRRWSDTIFDTFNVKLSTTTNATGSFSVSLASNIRPTVAYQQFTYDLTPYIGQDVYIAIQSNSHQGWMLYVDDVAGVPLAPIFTAPAAPDNLTPANLATGIALNAPLTWTLNGGGTAGVKLYLQANTNPPTTVTNLSATDNYTAAPVLLPNTQYFWKVAATNQFGESASAVQSFTTGAGLSYAASAARYSSYPDIGQFVMGAFANPAEPPAELEMIPTANRTYTDYSSLGVIPVNIGNTYPIRVSMINENYSPWNCEVAVYIDYNRNGAYDLLAELFYEGDISSGANPLNGISSTIPASASLGNTGMRVVLKDVDENPILPTGLYNYGETEDYLVSIAAAIPPVPVTLVFPANAASMIAKPFTLSWTPALSGGTPTGYTVYMSMNPATVLTDHNWATTGTSFSPIALGGLTVNYLDTWYWTVKAINAMGNATVTPPFSFQIMPDPTVTLPYYTDFSLATLPAGWLQSSTSGLPSDRWFPNEGFYICFGTEGTGTTRLISPPIITAGITDLGVEFAGLAYMYNADIVYKLQYSHDMVNWFDSSWSAPEGGFFSSQATVLLGLAAPVTYLSWTLEGDQAAMEACGIFDVQLAEFVAPAVQVSSSGLLTWDSLPVAPSYRVYSADTPDGAYTLEATVSVNFWQAPLDNPKKFYKVLTSSEYLPGGKSLRTPESMDEAKIRALISERNMLQRN